MNNIKCQNDLIKYMAINYDLPMSKSRKAIIVIFKAITSSLAKNIWVRIVGFGEFQKRIRHEKKGVNPKTKESLKIPRRQVIHCAFSTLFMKDES